MHKYVRSVLVVLGVIQEKGVGETAGREIENLHMYYSLGALVASVIVQLSTRDKCGSTKFYY